jgi:hypothetical protein
MCRYQFEQFGHFSKTHEATNEKAAPESGFYFRRWMKMRITGQRLSVARLVRLGQGSESRSILFSDRAKTLKAHFQSH